MKKLKQCFYSIIILLLLVIVYSVTYKYAEPKAYDYMVKNVTVKKFSFDTSKNIYGHDDIILVLIDNKTDEKYRWPWKRELNCKLFGYFKEYAQPKVVVHDSILMTLDRDNPNSDKKYFDLIKKFDNLIVGFMPIYDMNSKNSDEEFYKIFSEKFSLKVRDNVGVPEIYTGVMKFPKPYIDAVSLSGSVGVIPGFIDGSLSNSMDAINRNQQHILKIRGDYYSSLAFRTFLKINQNPEVLISKNYTEIPKLDLKIPHKKSLLQITIPIKFYAMNPEYGNFSHKKYSAVDIMDSYDNMKLGKKPVINSEIFKDKIVVIGANVTAANGLNDVVNTPISENYPGADFQATAIDNLIHHDFISVIPVWANIIITVFFMLCIYVGIRKRELAPSLWAALWTVVIFLSVGYVCFYYSVAINIITPVMMMIVTMIIAYTRKYVIENRIKEKVKSAMGKYISEDIMHKVLQNIDNLGLGGKKSYVTVLFSDIRGFTTLSENMSAQQVSELLNEYFTEMEPIVTKYNGIINKFIGDAVMAVFGEPIQDENHPQNAVRCGYEMLNRVKELNNKWEEEGKPKIEIGIGINTGEVFVGNIGSINRMEYTVIGDTVNLASRLESYNKIYNTKILISEPTYEKVGGIVSVSKISDVEIRGKAQKMNIYEVKDVKDI